MKQYFMQANVRVKTSWKKNFISHLSGSNALKIISQSIFKPIIKTDSTFHLSIAYVVYLAKPELYFYKFYSLKLEWNHVFVLLMIPLWNLLGIQIFLF